MSHLSETSVILHCSSFVFAAATDQESAETLKYLKNLSSFGASQLSELFCIDNIANLVIIDSLDFDFVFKDSSFLPDFFLNVVIIKLIGFIRLNAGVLQPDTLPVILPFFHSPVC